MTTSKTMTQPNWIKCSDQMPPDNDTEIIVMNIHDQQNSLRRRRGSAVFGTYVCMSKGDAKSYMDETIWTPYTPELWESLKPARGTE